MNDITALMATMKSAAEKATPGEWRAFSHPASGTYAVHTPNDKRCEDVIKWPGFDGQQNAEGNAEFISAANPANVLALVEALEKAQQSVELVDLQRDKIKQLESDLWDKEQLRKVRSEKSFELEGKVRELEARNQKDFVWRGKEISRLNDEVDELKERLESRTVTVKLPDPLMPAQHNSGELFMTTDNVIHGGYLNRDDVLRNLRAAGIQVIEGEG